MNKKPIIKSALVVDNIPYCQCGGNLVSSSCSDYYQVVVDEKSVTKFVKSCDLCNSVLYYYLDVTMDESRRFVLNIADEIILEDDEDEDCESKEVV